MKLTLIALTTVLVVHIFMTVLANRAHQIEMKNLLVYVEESTRIQRHICRALSPTELEKVECGQ